MEIIRWSKRYGIWQLTLGLILHACSELFYYNCSFVRSKKICLSKVDITPVTGSFQGGCGVISLELVDKIHQVQRRVLCGAEVRRKKPF